MHAYSSHPLRAGICAAIFICSLLSPSLFAQTVIKGINRFATDEGAINNFFGRSMAFDGNMIVVGAYIDVGIVARTGSAYIFDSKTGTQLHKLTAFDGTAEDWFGGSVAILGDIVAVGAQNDDDQGEDSGAVYLFDTQSGNRIKKVVPDDGETIDRFGHTVALSSEFLIVGALNDSDQGEFAGSVYIYDLATRELVTKIYADDAAPSDSFGSALAVFDQTLAVGSERDDDNGINSGSVYLFNLNTMLQTHKLVPDDDITGDGFGEVVSITDGLIAIGVPFSDGDGINSGSAYIFDTNTGEQLHKLIPSDISPDDRFGGSIAIENGKVIVGARNYDFDTFPYQESNAGTAYIFDTSTGQQIARLVPDEIEDSAGDFFSESSAINDGIIVVTSRRDNEHNSPAGAVHIFTIQGLIFADTSYFPNDKFPDNFGHSISVDADLMAVGVPFDREGGSNRGGAAYVFDTTTGSMLQKIIPDDGAFNVQFGRSVGINNDIIAIGAPFDSTNGQASSGTCYLYNANTASLIHKLFADDAQPADLFGHSVAIHNNIVAVGAYAEDENGNNAGAAYTFDATTGQQLAKLLPDDGFMNDQFGWSVAIENNVVVVGSINSDPGPVNTGAVYLFDATTGKQLAKLIAEDRWASDMFGQSVAINNALVAAGAPGDDIGTFSSGSAYLFDANTGAQLAKLTPSDPTAATQFGWSVDLNDSQLLVGIRRPEFPEVSPDKAYLFDLKTLEQTAILLPPDGTLGDRFGTAVSINNELAAVGASNEYERSDDSGTAYTFTLSAPVCPADFNNDGSLDFFDISVFLKLFSAHDPIADITKDGHYNFFDISEYLQLFHFGCP